jgi:hypothetical protein
MNAPPPEADFEYSRGIGHFRRVSRPDSGAGAPVVSGAAGAVLAGILAAGLLGAALLAVAEFSTLFEVHATGQSTPVKTVTTGAHQTYALLPVALLAGALAFVVWSRESRAALLAIGLLGLIALLIALFGDLPDARATGLIGSSVTQFRDATASPEVGLYLETLGAATLLITCVSGFILLGAPAVARARPRF